MIHVIKSYVDLILLSFTFKFLQRPFIWIRIFTTWWFQMHHNCPLGGRRRLIAIISAVFFFQNIPAAQVVEAFSHSQSHVPGNDKFWKKKFGSEFTKWEKKVEYREWCKARDAQD